tara:strand:- start:5860 stop:6357 length:498 start_codon:yes stop_codon:yes gene_type:complete
MIALNKAVNHEMEKCNVRNHRWSDAQLEDYKRHILNDPAVQSALEDDFSDACYQSYKRWAKAKAVIGNHMHNSDMDYNDWDTWASSPVKRRWWNIKQENPSTIIFVHVGKFYEVYHHDADILHKIFGAPYTYGYVAHNGFPVSKLDTYLNKLAEHGFNSIRIISV